MVIWQSTRIQYTDCPVGGISVDFSMYSYPTCSDEISPIIVCMKNNAPGVDSIEANIVKHVAPLTAEPLAILVNQSVPFGCFPSILREAVVSPVHKGKSKVEIGDYHPISVLTVISKIFERAMQVHTMRYLTEYSLLYENQYGF